MLRHLLDTNIVIHVIKQRPSAALEHFHRHAGHMALSSITVAEIFHGAEKSAQVQRNLAVVTNNRREFDRVPGLLVEDWAL